MSRLSESESGPWTADELADAVNGWCDRHGVRPLVGRAADRLTVRNIHYYRGLGILTSPGRGRGRSYGEKQFLELVAIRLLQARGLPHKKIQQLLHGRSIDDLKRIQQQGVSELGTLDRSLPLQQASRIEPSADLLSKETWNMSPLDERHLLVTRSGRAPGPRQVEWIRRILEASPAELDRLQNAAD